MAHERKAGEIGPPSAKMRSAIPPAKKDDLEDVAWALQTAEATWARGDHADALKWIRRAAEAASEAERDDRALELAKAAADVASLLAERPAPTPPPPLPTTPEAPRVKSTSRPPPALATGRVPGSAPTPAKVGTNMPPLPRAGQKWPTPPRVQTASPPVSRRGGRRSSPSMTEETPIPAGSAEVPRARRTSTTNETKRRGRSSKPSQEETAPLTARQPSTEEIEMWPTQSSLDDDLDDEQHTRIGTPAYRETAQRASAHPPTAPLAPLVMSQAVRVVVWRGADGVHVAPAGTQVAAIGVEAILVAMDPVADLAAWLSNK
jgi:hypothetical protein